MSNQLMNVKIEALVPNKANAPFTMNDIDVLEESIRRSGILTPITVCHKMDEMGKFTVISGHRRLEAAKRLGLEQVPIQIVDTPKTADDEFIEVCQANICRNSDEDKTLQMKAVAEYWETLADDKRDEWTKKLRENFEKRTEDQEEKGEFRVRDEFIRAITGVNLSNRSIRRKLSEEAIKEEPKKETPTKKKTKPLQSMAHSFGVALDFKTSENSDEEFPIEIQNKIDEIKDKLIELNQLFEKWS